MTNHWQEFREALLEVCEHDHFCDCPTCEDFLLLAQSAWADVYDSQGPNDGDHGPGND